MKNFVQNLKWVNIYTTVLTLYIIKLLANVENLGKQGLGSFVIEKKIPIHMYLTIQHQFCCDKKN